MVQPPGLPSSSLQSPLHRDEKREHICFGKNVFSGKWLPLKTNSAPKFIRSHPSVGESKGREHRGTSIAAALLALRGLTALCQVLLAANSPVCSGGDVPVWVLQMLQVLQVRRDEWLISPRRAFPNRRVSIRE